MALESNWMPVDILVFCAKKKEFREHKEFDQMTHITATYDGCGKDVTVHGVAVVRFHVGNTDTTRIK